MAKKIHIIFDDGNDFTLRFSEQSKGVLSFLLYLSERTKCKIVLLSGFSNQDGPFIEAFKNRDESEH
jgi:hypothetical protein